jgi:hypothetical protein
MTRIEEIKERLEHKKYLRAKSIAELNQSLELWIKWDRETNGNGDKIFGDGYRQALDDELADRLSRE